MIIIIVGAVGSGKTVSMVKKIVDEDRFCFTNFNMREYKNYHRLKVSDIIMDMGDEKKKKLMVNWKFWDDQRKRKGGFSVYLDEIHNIADSRSAMSNTNRLITRWLSQIRKITSDSENDLIIITQSIAQVDIRFRELAQMIISCRKIIKPYGGKNKGEKVYIQWSFYWNIYDYEIGRKLKTSYVFLANPYFRYYNTLDFVTFEDAEVYL